MLALAAALLPSRAGAFWPFSLNADAAATLSIPSSSTPALEAPLNTKPSAPLPIILPTSNEALVAYSGPSGSLADVAGSSSPGRISVYVVRPGDTLSEIADMFGVSVNTIVWANNLGATKTVRPGETLVILPVSGIERKVVKGDTLASLAKKYSADAGEIADFNGLDPAAPLAIGSTIIIPGGEIVAPPTPAKRSVATAHIHEPYRGGSGPAANGYFLSPVPGALLSQGIHGWNGVDFGAPRGTPILAAADGVVLIARAGGWNGGYGSYVVIQHGNGAQTLYAHASKVIAVPGQNVSAGQTIALVGNSGLSTGSHLHFEVRGAANPFRNCREGAICAPQ